MNKNLCVLLVCGSGASSSFMAAKMRLAAKQRGLDLTVTARAESELINYRGEVDAVMVGPHLAGYYEDLKKEFSQDCAVILMKKDYYGSLDGEKAIDHLEEELKNREKQ